MQKVAAILIGLSVFLLSGGVGFLVVIMNPDMPVNKTEFMLTPVVFILYLVAVLSFISLKPTNTKTQNFFYLLWIGTIYFYLELWVN